MRLAFGPARCGRVAIFAIISGLVFGSAGLYFVDIDTVSNLQELNRLR